MATFGFAITLILGQSYVLLGDVGRVLVGRLIDVLDLLTDPLSCRPHMLPVVRRHLGGK